MALLCTSCILLIGFLSQVSAAIVGTNIPAQALTLERVVTLPKAQQSAWKKYLKRSDRQLKADQTFLQKELLRRGIRQATLPPPAKSAKGILLDKPADWYSQIEAGRIAEIVVSFQTLAGGWSKNLDMTLHPRAPGEGFAPDNDSRHLGPLDFDTPPNSGWNYVGTFDNDATITQLRYLAKVISAVGPREAAPYRKALLRGLDYIFAAQYPNGGWPQVWPLLGGYHDTITYNDGAMINVMTFLLEVSGTNEQFAFVAAKARAAAKTSVRRGVECILATQIVEDGHHTVWCQQHEALSLQPASARNYEVPSECSAESAGIMMFLMKLPNPDPGVVAEVRSAAEWFEKTGIPGVAFQTTDGDRRLVAAPGNARLWSRFYEIGTDRPIFADRDKTIHDHLEEISRERRNGYAWYGGAPNRALEQYRIWALTHPLPSHN